MVAHRCQLKEIKNKKLKEKSLKIIKKKKKKKQNKNITNLFFKKKQQTTTTTNGEQKNFKMYIGPLLPK